MAGLLDGNYTPDPLAQGLLGLGSALLTPRQLGGGLMAGANAFTQGASQAAMLRRQMAQDAMRQKLLESQIAENDAQIAERKRKAELEQQLQAAARGAYTPARPGMADENNPYVTPKDMPASFDMQKFFGGVAQVAPLEAMRLRKEMMGDTKPVVVGDSLVDPTTGRAIFQNDKPQPVAAGSSLVGRDGQVVFNNPKPVEPTAMERALQAAGIDPKSPQGLQLLRSYATKTATHAPPVQVDARTVFPKQMAGVDAKIAEGDMTKWEAARSARASLRGIMQSSPGAASGPMANVAVSAVDFLSSIGVASEPLQKMSADSAQFNSQATELMLANIKKLGANPSNADREELAKMVPQITRSKAARDRVAQIMLKYTNRAEFDARHRFNYVQENSGSKGWSPVKINEMPSDKKALMPGAVYQHPVTQEIAVYRGNGQFDTIVGDD